MLFMTKYTPILIGGSKFKNFAEIKHPNIGVRGLPIMFGTVGYSQIKFAPFLFNGSGLFYMYIKVAS